MADNSYKVANLMVACRGCGKCREVCPSRAHGGCDPYEAMQGRDGGVLDCIGCGKCSEVCRYTDPKQVMMHLQQQAKGLKVPESFVRFGTVAEPAGDGWRRGLSEVPEGDGVYVMPGCIVEGFEPFLKHAAAVALAAIGVGSGELPRRGCCMYPVALRSMTDGERDRHKLALGRSSGGRRTVTLCAGCHAELDRAGVEFPYILDEFLGRIDAVRALPGVRMRVAVEPGCSMEARRDEVEELVEACGCETVGNPSGCCGKSVPRIGGELMAERQEECRGADAVVLCCPNCERFYDAVPGGLPVLHIAELVALAAGNSETQRFHRIPLPPGVLGTL